MRAVLLSLLIVPSAFAEAVVVPTLSEQDTKKLNAGEILIREFTPTGGKGVGSLSIGVVEAPSDEVNAIISNCTLFWQFMPRVKKSWVKEDATAGTICHVELTMPFPLPDLWSDSTHDAREEPKGHHYRGWKMVRGSYHRNDGSWTIIPWGDGSKSMVVYSVDSDPKMAVPDALIRLGQVTSLPEVITRIRQRVVTLRAAATTAAAPSK